MKETYISFYLRDTRIRIFVETLRALGNPSRISLLIDNSGDNLLITPHDKRDFKSHHVPSKVYTGTAGMEISSYKLCRIIAGLHNWDLAQSYRVPGKLYPEQKAAVFNLKHAEIIDHNERIS